MTEQPTLLHKNMPVAGVKILDEEQGIVEAFVAGIGNKDSVGDIIQPGAFIDSLGTRVPKGVWSHNWDQPVSKTLEIFEVTAGDPRLPLKLAAAGAGGLYVKTQFNLKTQRGRDAYEDVKFFGEESEWSIGYMENVAEYSKELGANLLYKIDLYEYSPVLFGANPLTSTVGVKVVVSDMNAKIQIMGLDDKDLEAKVADAVKGALEVLDDEKAGEGGETPEAKDAPVDPEVKVVPGSLEARRAAISEAVESAFPGYCAWPVATFESTVVVQVYESYALEMAELAAGVEGSDADETDDESKEGYWMFSYAIGGDGKAVLGDPQAVDVVEVVVAKQAMEQLDSKGLLTDEAREQIGEKVIPFAFDEKAGRVLSSKNLDRLNAAKAAIEEVLGSADAKDPEAEEKTLDTDADGEIEEKSAEVGDPDADAEPEPDPEPEAAVKSNAICGQMFKADDGGVRHCEKAPGHEDVLHGVPETEEKADEPEVNEWAPSVHEFKTAEDGTCEVCQKDDSFWMHSEKVVAAVALLTEESEEKAAEFVASIAKAFEATKAAELDAFTDESVSEIIASATESGLLAEKSESEDPHDLAGLVAAIEASIEVVIDEASAGATEKAMETLAATDAAVEALVAALDAADVPEEKVVETGDEGKTAEMVTLDPATLLELEIILAEPTPSL